MVQKKPERGKKTAAHKDAWCNVKVNFPLTVFPLL
jgi:hypothetical protein